LGDFNEDELAKALEESLKLSQAESGVKKRGT